ncbi:MAG: hypothetical protein EZS26_002681 [Candidatus Ordinivivax streblomastigis]|uniref:Uncharacterized protein n=1 Tax=Candidatus Ordinivivax streblomastigis TaxID=2540710 RepID=A0A5M8NWV8_9BACT|nr:MAG: hypothetical protein EZS26_002681 [Candidatus Ordinivivax streblomastigis]
MEYQEVLILAKSLSKEEQLQLIVSLSPKGQEEDTGALRSRCAALINKQEPLSLLWREALSSLWQGTWVTTFQVQ